MLHKRYPDLPDEKSKEKEKATQPSQPLATKSSPPTEPPGSGKRLPKKVSRYKMGDFSDVPIQILARLLSAFLTIKEVSAFDCAITTPHARRNYLESIKAAGFPRQNQKDAPVSVNALTWLREREMYLQKLHLIGETPLRCPRNILSSFEDDFKVSKHVEIMIFDQVSLDENVILDLVSNAPLLRECAFIECSKTLDVSSIVRRMSSRCEGVVSLELCKQRIDYDVLTVIAECFPKLESLHVDFHCFGEMLLTKQSLTRPLSRFSSLTSLSLAHELIDDVVVHTLGETCRGMKYLSLGQLVRTTDTALSIIAVKFPTIIQLSLSEEYWKKETLDIELFSDTGIKTLTASCTTLKVLRLHNLCGITDDSIESLADNVPRIQQLCLRDCENIGEVGIRALGEKCMDLERVDVTGCTWDCSIFHNDIFSTCCLFENLRSLALRFTLADLSRFYITKYIQRNATLEELELTNHHEGTIKEIPGLISLLESCANIRVLRLRFFLVTNVLLVKIAEHCARIEELHLQECHNVFDREGLFAFVAFCPRLTWFEFGDSDLLPPDARREIRRKRPFLRI
jgi:hypothetical protein